MGIVWDCMVFVLNAIGSAACYKLCMVSEWLDCLVISIPGKAPAKALERHGCRVSFDVNTIRHSGNGMDLWRACHEENFCVRYMG